MVKTLDFMGLKYKDLYSNSSVSATMRETLYKEDSNVLSYYIITTILMNNYQGFLSWCNTNNLSLLQFKKSTSTRKPLVTDEIVKERAKREGFDYMWFRNIPTTVEDFKEKEKPGKDSKRH
jgi:accessory gene regulator protein AgrB